VISVSNAVIAIVFAIMYVSITSLFLLVPSSEGVKYPKLLSKKAFLAIVAACVTAATLVSRNFKLETLVERSNNHYTGVAGLTLLMTTLLVMVLLCIFSLFQVGPNGKD
jgi:hypothetical protein